MSRQAFSLVGYKGQSLDRGSQPPKDGLVADTFEVPADARSESDVPQRIGHLLKSLEGLGHRQSPLLTVCDLCFP